MTKLQTDKDLQKQRDQELFEKFKKENTNINLYYVDYDDSLSENPDVLQEIAQTGYTNANITERREIGEVIDNMIEETFDEEEKEYVMGNNDLLDDITDYCYENDQSDIIRDLLENTTDCLFLVDLDFYFEDPTYSDQEEYREHIIDFLKSINQEPTDELINDVRIVAREAVYGGKAYAGLYTDPSDFYNEKKKNIKIDDLHLIIIDHGNGSGWHNDVGSIYPIIVSRSNIHLDETVGYSFQEIFGYDGDDCISSFDFTDEKNTIGENEEANQLAKQEEKWKKDYRETGCAGVGCPKFKYHKTHYVNDVPAGNKCEICGKFFID